MQGLNQPGISGQSRTNCPKHATDFITDRYDCHEQVTTSHASVCEGDPIAQKQTEEQKAEDVAAEVGTLAGHHPLDVAVAESLTGGKVANQLAAAEGSGEWFVGALVAYQTRIKHPVLSGSRWRRHLGAVGGHYGR